MGSSEVLAPGDSQLALLKGKCERSEETRMIRRRDCLSLHLCLISSHFTAFCSSCRSHCEANHIFPHRQRDWHSRRLSCSAWIGSWNA